mmetsp:Transcript_7486/g.21246  ORF Transcript_7486/g.21246 Transcript_7486/m.21246 type:complete len:223 (-) Transcript_7486:1430-2098(-)
MSDRLEPDSSAPKSEAPALAGLSSSPSPIGSARFWTPRRRSPPQSSRLRGASFAPSRCSSPRTTEASKDCCFRRPPATAAATLHCGPPRPPSRPPALARTASAAAPPRRRRLAAAAASPAADQSCLRHQHRPGTEGQLKRLDSPMEAVAIRRWAPSPWAAAPSPCHRKRRWARRPMQQRRSCWGRPICRRRRQTRTCPKRRPTRGTHQAMGTPYCCRCQRTA